MATLSVISNSGPLVFAGGRHLRVRGKTIGDYGEACAQVELMKGSWFDRARFVSNHIPKEHREKVLSGLLRAFRHKHIDVTSREMCRWLCTLEGRVYSFWQAVRDNGVDYEWCVDAYCSESERDQNWERQIQWAIEIASGDGESEAMWEIVGKGSSNKGEESGRPFAATFGMLTREPFSYSPDQISAMTFGQLAIVLRDTAKNYDDIGLEAGAKHLRGDDLYLQRKKILKTYDKAYVRFARNMAEGRHILSDLEKSGAEDSSNDQ